MNEKLLGLLVDRVRDYALFVLDPQGCVLSWNLGAELIKGYKAEEIIGRHFSVFYTQNAVRDGWPEHELKIATMQGRFEDEGWRIRKDGSRFWANVVITALRDDDGRLLGYSKITRDLSVRRAAEEALRDSEERLRLLLEGVSDYAIYMLNREGVVSSWNAGAQRIMGYAPEEIMGKHFSQFYPPDDIRAGKPWEELASARRDGRVEDEGWRLRKNGERYWARVVVNPLYDTHGHLRGFAKVTQDLTERQHARELEKTAQRVNEFIAVLSHELRNPLAPIASAVEVMNRAPAADPVQRDMTALIQRQVTHLNRLLDDMLDIQKVTRGVLTVNRRPLDLSRIVAAAIELCQPEIDAAGHTVALDVTAGLWTAGDAERLTQVLANLLTNAVRYTPSGGQIAVTATAEGREAVISVRDTGRGIAAGELDLVFGMFVQGKEPLNRVGGGLGIGLALARRIVELHDGTIEARSEGEDKGSEFIVRLPLAARAGEEIVAKPPAAGPARERGPRKILIVDDNEDAALTLELLLQSLGHETRVAHDGPQALEIAVDFHPDVALLDIGLPGINGYEVGRRLRARQTTMKIVAVTGWGKEEDRSRSKEAGFDRHLVKPVSESELRQVLEGNGNGNGATIH